MNKHNISVGCDPELFLENNNGEIVSAEGLIGGTKHEPRPISKNGHTVQEDNIMVEFNVPPSYNSDEFIENINFVKEYLETFVNKKNLTLNYSASAILDEKYLNTKQAKVFGCEPDFNVYLKDVNPKPDSSLKLRSCGGHIHFGYLNPEFEKTENIIKCMDIFLGLPSVWLDSDTRRRIMYGKAGSFRVKNFGGEYRTLSNFWIKDDKSIKWAFDNTIKAIKYALNSDLSWISEYEKDIQIAINESDVELAKNLYTNLCEKFEVKNNVKNELKK